MERHIRAFGIELLFGYMGFLGIGWLYARRWLIGLLLLVVWFPFLLGVVLVIINLGNWTDIAAVPVCATLLLFPVYVGLPMLSAHQLRRRIAPPPRTPAAPAESEPSS